MRFYSQHYNGKMQVATLRDFLSLPSPTIAVLTTAYATKAGIEALERQFRKIGGVLDLYVGVRNAITSEQAIRTALDYGVNVYTVDTGTPSLTFHEKTGYIANTVTSRMMITSANLTKQALFSNIETGCTHDIDLGDPEQLSMEEAFVGHMEWLRDKFPENVVKVTGEKAIQVLVDRGVLADEGKKFVRSANAKGDRKRRDNDTVPKMKFETKAPTDKFEGPMGELFWQSRPLSRRKLSIPEKATTNSYGSMLLTQGRFHVDQRHYFRDVVFDALDWKEDGHFERATAPVKLVIRGVDYGEFDMKVSHNTRTDTTAYAQNNGMTSLHWGEAQPFVAREDLLGCTLSVYRTDDHYLIDIS